MEKLRPKKGVSSVSQKIAQMALDEKESQDAYIETLKEVKSEMYNQPVDGEEASEEVTTDNEVKKLRKKDKGVRRGELRILVDAELAEVYKLIAVQEGISISSYISNILENYLMEHQKEIKSLLKTRNKFLS